jgi:hypothetical protein
MMKAILTSSPQSNMSGAAIMTNAYMASAAPAPAAQKLLTASARQFLRLGRLDLAEALVERALTEDECCADAQSLLANITDRRGDWQGSLVHLRRAYALAPDAPQVRLNLALALLRLEEYREGFALYEARIDKPTWSGFATLASRTGLRHLLLHPGESVKNKRVLVLAEQGFGDAIMCARYVPMLARRGARIAIACHPSLRCFFERIASIETLLSPPADQPFAQLNLEALPFDAWVPMMSLPRWFETDVTSAPTEVPYWTPHESRVAPWRSRLASIGRPGVRKVALVFQANPLGAGHAAKSMTIEDILPLPALADVDILNFQHGPVGKQLAASVTGIIDPLPEQMALDEYAAALAATDLLITVDTMAAHLAGAMAHPAWVAVPHSPHWAWGLDRETTPWYPSLQIFRQDKPHDWSNTVATLAMRLNANIVSSGRTAPVLERPTPRQATFASDRETLETAQPISDAQTAEGPCLCRESADCLGATRPCPRHV